MPWKNGNPPLYTVWKSMVSRCYRKSTKQFKDYGGRGIKVCHQWRHSYKQWYSDMGPSYIPGLTQDRIDNNGDYSPENCRWATHKEQQRNRRMTYKAVIEGKEYLVIDLAEKAGMKFDSILARIRKMPSITLSRLLDKTKFAKGGKEVAPKVIPKWRKGSPHCKRGHEFNQTNTHITPTGTRLCRTCDAMRRRHRRAGLPI